MTKVPKVTDNGRKSMEELQEMFDKVVVRYFPGTATGTDEKTGEEITRETMKTVVALVLGNEVHVGISKWSNRGLEYSKTAGRARAAGRAEIAFNTSKNLETPRKSHIDHTTNENLSYTFHLENPTVKNVVCALIGVEELNNELV